MVDASEIGVLLSKSYNEAYESLERIANNNYQWPSTKQAAAKGTARIHDIDALTSLIALSAQITTLTNMIQAITTAPTTVNQVTDVSCFYCGEGHLFDNCPGNLASANYMGNFNRKKLEQSIFKHLQPGWRQHSNFSWSN